MISLARLSFRTSMETYVAVLAKTVLTGLDSDAASASKVDVLVDVTVMLSVAGIFGSTNSGVSKGMLYGTRLARAST